MSTEVESAVTPFLKGAFAMFHTPDGGVHISYRPDGADADEHIQIPGVMMAIVRDMQETGKMPNPLALIKMLRGS